MRISDWSSDVCSSDLSKFTKITCFGRKDPGNSVEPIGEPAVEKGFVGRALFGERQVALALERLDGLQQHRLARGSATVEEASERRQGPGPEPAIDGDVGIVAGTSVEGVRSEEHTSELQSLMRISY